MCTVCNACAQYRSGICECARLSLPSINVIAEPSTHYCHCRTHFYLIVPTPAVTLTDAPNSRHPLSLLPRCRAHLCPASPTRSPSSSARSTSTPLSARCLRSWSPRSLPHRQQQMAKMPRLPRQSPRQQPRQSPRLRPATPPSLSKLWPVGGAGGRDLGLLKES